MNTKGMGVGQVFIFIISAITFALIMIFGYQSVSQFIESGEEVAFVQFKTSLENDIKKIYTEFGSARINQYSLPNEYEQICFVDMDAEYTTASSSLCQQDPVACSAWEDSEGYAKEEENVFLRPVAPVPIKVYEIKIEEEEDYLCFNITNGGFELYIEGRGDHTVLGRPE